MVLATEGFTRQNDTQGHKKTVLVKAAFAGNTSWCQHRFLAIEGFSEGVF